MRGHGEFTLTWSLNLFLLTKMYFLKKHDMVAVVEMARFALLFSPSGSGASALALVRCFPWLALLLSSGPAGPVVVPWLEAFPPKRENKCRGRGPRILRQRIKTPHKASGNSAAVGLTSASWLRLS